MSDIQVFYEATPNPDSMKFVVTANICDQTVNYAEPTETQSSPLAAKIFGFPWASGIMIGPNFVTVTKQDWVDWEILAEPLSNLIKEHLVNDEPVFINVETVAATSDDDPNDSPVVKQIKDILNRDVRPAVALDGGDIVFSKYENNNVYVHMKGACSGCPSASMTLKQGVEARLRSAIPEIKEVISI